MVTGPWARATDATTRKKFYAEYGIIFQNFILKRNGEYIKNVEYIKYYNTINHFMHF